MKTTIEINDELLREAKARAQDDGATLREVVEASLRSWLRVREPAPKYVRIRVSKQPPGFAPGFDPDDIATMKELGRER